MNGLRWTGIAGALALMLGEIFRSWGVGRPIAFVLDDMIAGVMMLTAAVLVARPTRARRCYFSAAWGVAAGMLYGSFFGKLFAPETATPGHFPLGLLTALLGLALVLAVGGLILSIVLPDEGRTA